jgi:hypothetical protein
MDGVGEMKTVKKANKKMRMELDPDLKHWYSNPRILEEHWNGNLIKVMQRDYLYRNVRVPVYGKKKGLDGRPLINRYKYIPTRSGILTIFLYNSLHPTYKFAASLSVSVGEDGKGGDYLIGNFFGNKLNDIYMRAKREALYIEHEPEALAERANHPIIVNLR